MAWPAIAAAVIGGVASLVGSQMANQANAEEASKNRGWQEYMSNTAHQREFADLRSAGINPILYQGSGAGMGSGGQAVMENSVGKAVEAAVNSARATGEIANRNADTELTKEKTLTEQTNQLANVAAAQQAYSSAKKNQVETTLTRYAFPKAKLDADLAPLDKGLEVGGKVLDLMPKRIIEKLLPGNSKQQGDYLDYMKHKPTRGR